MATAKKTKVSGAVETKTVVPRRKPAAAAAKRTRTATAKTKSAVEVKPEEIERLAYRLWEERGRPEGTSSEDWNRAQTMLLESR
jgi:hypothetical protein